MLRAFLADLKGKARFDPLMRLGAMHSQDFQRETQAGRPDDADLDAAISALSEAHSLLDPPDPLRPNVATILGRHLATRYLTRSIDADRDTAIDLFEESLRSAELPPPDVEIGHFYAGQLLAVRGLPGGGSGALSGDPVRGLVGIDVAALFSRFGVAQGDPADLNRAIAHFDAVVEGPGVVPEVHQAAAAMVGPLRLVTQLTTGIGGLAGMFESLSGFARPSPPGVPGAADFARMREVLMSQHVANTPPVAGPLDALVDQAIHRGSGIDVRMTSFLREFVDLTEDARLSGLVGQALSQPLDAEAIGWMAAAVAQAVAYPVERSAEALLQAADRLTERDERHPTDPVTAGSAALLRAMALLLASRPGEAAHALEAALTGLPAEHPSAQTAVELLILLLDDRYPLDGWLSDTEAVHRVAGLVGPAVAAGGSPVAKAADAVLRLALDRADSVARVDLHSAVDALDPSYPWGCRPRGVLGALLGDDYGVGLLLDNAARIPTDHAARDAALAVAAFAALHASEWLGASGSEAVDRLSRLADDSPRAARALLTARVDAAIAAGDPAEIHEVLRQLEQAAFEISPSTDPIEDACRIGATLARAYRTQDERAFMRGALETLRMAVAAESVGVTSGIDAAALGLRAAAAGADIPRALGLVEALDLGAAAATYMSSRVRLPFGLEPPGATEDEVRLRRVQRHLPATVTPPTARDIASALLATNAAGLAYLYPGQDRIFLVTDDDHVEPLAAPRLTAARPVMGPGGAGLADVCDWAGAVLLRPMLDRMRAGWTGDVHRLVLVPVGELSQLPWHAARVDGEYAVTKFAFTYASSGAEFVAAAHRPQVPIYQRPILISGPDDGDDEVRTLSEVVYPNADRFSADDLSAADPSAPLASLIAGGASMIHFASPVSMPRSTAAPRAPGGLAVLTAAARSRMAASELLAAGFTDVVERMAGWSRPPVVMVVLLHHYLVDLDITAAEALRRAQVWMLDPDRRLLDHLDANLVADLTDPADPASWASLRHHGQ